MKKEYLFKIVFFVFIISIMYILTLKYSQLTLITTMCSILIPVAITFLLDYDNKRKELLQNYYLPLFLYIRTYFDILSASDDEMLIGTKHDLIDNITTDIYNFLYDNAKYMSDELEFVFNQQYIYRYFNNHEFQRNYNVIRIMPIILKEYIELYSMLHFDQLCRLKLNNNNSKIELRLLYVTYVQSVILEISRKANYIDSIYGTVELHKQTIKNDHIDTKYIKIGRYLLKNYNDNIDYNKLEAYLTTNYNISIQLPNE